MSADQHCPDCSKQLHMPGDSPSRRERAERDHERDCPYQRGRRDTEEVLVRFLAVLAAQHPLPQMHLAALLAAANRPLPGFPSDFRAFSERDRPPVPAFARDVLATLNMEPEEARRRLDTLKPQVAAARGTTTSGGDDGLGFGAGVAVGLLLGFG